MEADGSDQTLITPSGFFSPTGEPSWSPDGTKIVFQGTPSARGSDLYVVNSDGTGGLTRLTDTPEFEGTPAWSPDGSKIAFSRFVPPCVSTVCNFEIFVMNADGTGVERLTFDEDQDSDPSWSPDGAQIAWGNLNGVTDIRVMNADGSDQRGYSPPALGYEPAWSPRGDMIAWNEPGDISVMNADGTDRRSVTDAPSFDVAPDWQPLPNEPPDCTTVRASRPEIRAHHRGFVRISLDGATDPDGDAVTLDVDSVTQDEPVKRRGDRTAPDAKLKGGGLVRVRAERSPHGDGRVYRIAFTATDEVGASCSGYVTVSVPRKKRKPAVDSAPPSYDSLAGG
jgi:Tol biopolymer transport system component